MRSLIYAIGLLAAASACVETPAPRHVAPTALTEESTGQDAAPIDVDSELAHLRAALMCEVRGVMVDSP